MITSSEKLSLTPSAKQLPRLSVYCVFVDLSATEIISFLFFCLPTCNGSSTKTGTWSDLFLRLPRGPEQWLAHCHHPVNTVEWMGNDGELPKTGEACRVPSTAQHIASALCTAMMSTVVIVAAVCPSTPVSPPAKQKHGSLFYPSFWVPSPLLLCPVPGLSVPVMAGPQPMISVRMPQVNLKIKLLWQPSPKDPPAWILVGGRR